MLVRGTSFVGSDRSIRAALESNRVTKATRDTLLKRLEAPPVLEPGFFERGELELLRCVCARLIPDPGAVDIAGGIDTRLSQGKTDGWRYDSQAPDGKAYKQGLTEINNCALERHDRPFTELRPEGQDGVLLEAQRGSPRFFEDLLAETVEVYYSHPLAQAEIGYEGFADAHGWLLDGETHPPEPVKEEA